MHKSFFIFFAAIFIGLGFGKKSFLEQLSEKGECIDTPSKAAVQVPASDAFEIGSYLPFWGLNTYKRYAYDEITSLHMIATISGASVLEDRGLIWGDNDTLPTAYHQPPLDSILSYVRSVNPRIKIVLALSDLHITDQQRSESAALFNDINRNRTINFLMKNYVDKYGFDGVDIDFEDATLDNHYVGDNYPMLIRDLAAALHDPIARGVRKYCVVTLNSGDYKLSNINNHFVFDSADLIQVMDYGRDKIDYSTTEPYRRLKVTAPEWAAFVPKAKLSFGIAVWSQYANDRGKPAGDAYPYSDLLKLKPSDTTFIPYLTTSFYAPNQPDGYRQRYNGLYEARRKAEYIKDEGYRGLFTWDITKEPTEPGYVRYSVIGLINDWNQHRARYPAIVGYTNQDYYSHGQSIEGGFHSLRPSRINRVGIYNFRTGQPAGYHAYLPDQSSGNFSIPASVTRKLPSNQLYILKFYGGADGVADTFWGTSNPFYKL